MRTYGALPFNVTPDHPVLSQKRKCKDHRYEGFKEWGFNPIGELNKKDVIALPKTPVLFENCLSYDELWMIGYYVGDGYTTGGRYKVCANEAKAVEVDKHVDGNKQLCFKTCIEYELRKSGHEEMIMVMSHCGSNAYEKVVPNEILFGTKEAKRAFLDGYLSADGCAVGQSFNTVSPTLAISLSRLLFDLDIGCSIFAQKRPPQGQIWDPRLNAYRTFNQREVIYNCGMNDNKDDRIRQFLTMDTMTLVPIKEKSTEAELATVYTLTTDGDHTYTANNLGVHNCDVFVDHCFITTFGTELGMKLLCQSYKGLGAGVKWSANYYKTKGQFYESNPQPGDQIFFGDATSWWHTALVVKVDNKYVYTIEGNTTSSAGVVANGGCVAQKRYLLTYKNIKGYGRPDWNLAVGAQEMAPVAVPNTGVEMEDDDMTQEKFNEMMDNYLAGLAAKDGSSWSEEARQFCIDKGLFIGGNPDENGDPAYMWRSYMTREALAQVMVRFANLMGLK